MRSIEKGGGKMLLGVAIAAVVGPYWARPDLMVALPIVIAVGVYGWKCPGLRGRYLERGLTGWSRVG